MAGGRGERFWPVSREKTPKQLITLLGGRSFLQQAVDRVAAVVPPENILIITNKVQAPTVRKQLPQLPAANVVAEPVGRDTCAAVTLGAALVGAKNPNGVMAVLPADHVIPEPEKFQQVLNDAFAVAAKDATIVTIGIKPNEPATGYGYIRSGAALPTPEGAEPYKTAFFVAEQFVEKPPYEKAVEYLAAGNYRWNAGMFVWSYPTILAGLKQHQPDMAIACERWLAAAAKGPEKLTAILKKQYPEIRKISIDFALMEKANNVVVADGAFEWDDLGAWPALARHIKPDANGNSAVGTLVHVDSERNVVYDARTKKQTPITLVGIKDAIIVLTDDATLVASKNEAQKIKDLVKKMGADPVLAKLV
ncbi:MAG TPA: sugar phosphate nucleotidyltransferase [Candidatus Limnocylindria bacterium]|nr:sugar phosphate nucleotidyltransferase [Candidatus Limnocylindria bacterium]